ncbi:MAG TPA: 3-oxoacyl-[acyl-carrier-protein] synthase III C-terminal domain-containing protein [Alphaproteobacteria bacterium]|jgi:3-hydroxy-3-methylglutaryl CoA synthase
MPGIIAYGGYVPRLRLQRKSMVEANAWFNPGLASYAKGERAICNWDEDAVTMAVAAARDCLSAEPPKLDAVYFASTTLPFQDRQCATLLATALDLPDGIETLDLTTSQRAATSALIAGLKRGGSVLLAAAEHRRTKAASALELLYGDAAAALLLGPGDGLAKLVATHSVSNDFVDHYRGETESFDYMWEERWIRDEGYMKIVPQALAGLAEKAKAKGADIAHFILPCLFAGVPQTIAKRLGIPDAAVRDNLQGAVGNTGAAHAIVMLVHALQQAKPGEKILVIGFGQGCDALLFEATPAISQLAPREGVAGALRRGRAEVNYNRFLAFNNLVVQEGGMRSEMDRQTPLSMLYRNRDMLTALNGGRCTKCGTRQFPKSHICVNPNCGALDTQEDAPFANTGASIVTWSADWLTYTPDPPAHYGMVQFDGGGRMMADFTDVDPGSFDVGTKMRMVFRVREYDRARGFRKYFWKATPVAKS